MENTFICDNKFWFVSGSICLPVKIPNNLPKEVVAEGYSLPLKSEFHVTLVSIGKIIEKHNIVISDFESLIIKEFCDFVKNNDVSLIGLRKEFYFVKRDEKRSMVVMCNISNLDKFLKILNNKYSLNLEIPPTHITLYALNDRGIFLVDSNDMNLTTKSIGTPNPLKSWVNFNPLFS